MKTDSQTNFFEQTNLLDVILLYEKQKCDERVFFYSKRMPTLHELNLRNRTLWKNEKTYNFAQIERKISTLALKWSSNYSLQIE